MIYLASPYSHSDPEVVEARYRETCRVLAREIKLDQLVISPIVMCHPLVKLGQLSGNWDFWKKLDLNLLKQCDELRVTKMRGWETSVGVCAEMDFAEDNDLTLSFCPGSPEISI